MGADTTTNLAGASTAQVDPKGQGDDSANAAIRMSEIERKVDYDAPIPYNDLISHSKLSKVYPTGSDKDAQELLFEFNPSPYFVRNLNGQLTVEFKILQHDGTDYDDEYTEFLLNNAFVQEGMMDNLWSNVFVGFDKQYTMINVMTSNEYPTIARVQKLFSVLQKHEKLEKDTSDFGINREYELVTDNTRTNDDAHRLSAAQKAEAIVQPNVLPVTAQDPDTLAPHATIANQRRASERYSKFLKSSNTWRRTYFLNHPLFQLKTWLPLDVPVCVKLVRNENRKIFLAAANPTCPKVEIRDIYFSDTVFHLVPDKASALADGLIKKKGGVDLEVKRYVVEAYSAGIGQRVFSFKKILNERMPRRAYVLFVDEICRTQKGSAVHNDTWYQFPKVSSMKVVCNQTDKTYPVSHNNEGYVIKTNTANTEELDRLHHDVFDQNIKAASSNPNDLALKAKDWFSHNNVWCIDFSPTGMAPQTEGVVNPNVMAQMDLEIELHANPETNKRCVVIGEYQSMVTITYPNITIKQSWS